MTDATPKLATVTLTFRIDTRTANAITKIAEAAEEAIDVYSMRVDKESSRVTISGTTATSPAKVSSVLYSSEVRELVQSVDFRLNVSLRDSLD